MLFNSISFAFFLPIVFILYWFFTNGNLKVQNILLLIASYFFYGFWDYRFLFVLLFSTLLDFCVGIKMGEAKNLTTKKYWFWLSIIVNLGILCFFKYCNFFIDSFAQIISSIGFHPNIWSLKLILPVGISFYTFHGLSYIIDVYKGEAKPTKDIIGYAVFVSFFPLLVAGPIERAGHLLPQIQSKRYFNFNNAVNGLKQILWGLFKKLVIADNCAEYVNTIFNNQLSYSGSTLVIGALFFTFQIYCDFSGYSDIAIGTARLFGIDLLRNFAFPYFSRDIAEFWRRWHISLSSWFKDYLYIPLGGSNGSIFIKIRNVFIIFLVSGFWHGANWTFIVWGAINAFYFLPLLLLNKNRTHLTIVASGKYFPSLKDAFNILFTFSLTVFAWIFFRSESIQYAISFISNICSSTLFQLPEVSKKVIPLIGLILFFICIEWLGREREFAISHIGLRWPVFLRWSFMSFIIFLIGMYMQTTETPFIYFQF